MSVVPGRKVEHWLGQKKSCKCCEGRRSEICVVARVSPSPMGEMVLHRRYVRLCPGCQFQEDATAAEIRVADEALRR